MLVINSTLTAVGTDEGDRNMSKEGSVAPKERINIKYIPTDFTMQYNLWELVEENWLYM